MPILSLALLFALAFGVVLILSKPVFESHGDRRENKAAEKATLHSERERLLAALQELDFDHGLGKMNAEDYAAQRSELMAEAVEVEKKQETPALPNENGGEVVDGWVGALVSKPPGAQFNDYFQVQNQEGGLYGIDGSTDEIRLALEGYRDSDTPLKIWGTLMRDCPDMNGMQIRVTRVEEYQP